MSGTDRIGPTLSEEGSEGGAAPGLDQRIVVPGSRLIDVEGGGSNIVVSGQYDRQILLEKFRRMPPQPFQPVQLVVEFRSGLGIAVRRIEARNDHAANGGFNVTRLTICRVAGQFGPDQDGIGFARQNGDAVPGPLSSPDRAVTCLFDRAKWKFVLGGLELLQADNVGL